MTLVTFGGTCSLRQTTASISKSLFVTQYNCLLLFSIPSYAPNMTKRPAHKNACYSLSTKDDC